MKKLIILPLVLLIAACGGSKPSAPSTENDVSAVEALQTVKTISASEKSKKTDAFSKIRSCEYDFNADGTEDVIALYSNVQSDESGKTMWDDFHKWLLEVELSTGEYYTLFDNSISTGQLYFEVFEIYNEEVTPAVAVFTASGSGMDIQQFTFDGKSFNQTKIYSTEDASTSGINKIYSSIPFYK